MSKHDDFNLDELASISDQELAKKIKKLIQILDRKQQAYEDLAKWENLYWILQTERLKRLKGKNY